MSDGAGRSEWTTVRLGDLRAALETLAVDNDRSLSGEIRYALRRHIEAAQADEAWVSANGKAAAPPGPAPRDGGLPTGEVTTP